MPLQIRIGASSLVIRKEAFERAGLSRPMLDERFNLTADEFAAEGDIIVLGPLVGEQSVTDLLEELERSGLTYFDDFFELSGNWPEWLALYAMGERR